jgi:hypothetical protein
MGAEKLIATDRRLASASFYGDVISADPTAIWQLFEAA